MKLFYTRLKDHVKDEILCGDRPDELFKIIEAVIHINNRMYER
jgi:hypothetical protein